MNKLEVIRKTREFRDFYGQDLSDISNLRTKGDCLERLEAHRHFLENQHIDALSHIDDFIRNLDF